MKYLSLAYILVFLFKPKYLSFFSASDSTLYLISLLCLCYLFVSNIFFKLIGFIFVLVFIFNRLDGLQVWFETSELATSIKALFIFIENSF